MMSCFSFLGGFIGFCITLLTVIILYFKWSYQYWKKRNVPSIEPKIPFGNYSSPFDRKENTSVKITNYYNTLRKQKLKHGGLYNFVSPQYLVTDLDILKNIMTKDFQHFTDRSFYSNEKADPLSGQLFLIGGTKWKNLRAKLTPTFTSGKMKMMFQTLVNCIPFLLEKIDDDSAKNIPIDIKNTLGCFTTDIIGSCAFGIECNSFKEPNSPFRYYTKKVFIPSKKGRWASYVCQNFPELAKFLGLRIFAEDVTDFFMKMVKDTVDYREKNNIIRKDFLQLLIELKNNKPPEEEGYLHDGKTLTMAELTAQCFVFFLAGFETSSTTMTFALYELARNQDLQQKVREEINEVLEKHGGNITYEAIQEMKYMDQVLNETLRKYPPVPFLNRKCMTDYKIPGEDLTIEKGTVVLIPIYGIHHDEEYYPDPQKFDPERFTEENKRSRHSYAHIPFGEGPRICIGMRFGLMQSKVGLTVLLKNYVFTVNKKTEEPLKMKMSSFLLSAQGEIWLTAEKINKK